MSGKKWRLILILVICFGTLTGLFLRFLAMNSDPFRNFHSIVNLANSVVIRQIHPETGHIQVVQVVDDPQDVAYLNSMLEFVPEQTWKTDASYGYALLEWHQGERVITLATVHSGGLIRWQGFSQGDAQLAPEAIKNLENWLSLGGVAIPGQPTEKRD